MIDCLFCRIVAGEVPAEVVYEDASCLAFKDIHPKAPVHVLIVPREHIESLAALTPEQVGLAGRLIAAAQTVARRTGVAERGFRLITNAGPEAGQIVPHLHWHLLGGRPLGPKMVVE